MSDIENRFSVTHQAQLLLCHVYGHGWLGMVHDSLNIMMDVCMITNNFDSYKITHIIVKHIIILV